MANRPDMHVGDYGTIVELTILHRHTKRPLDLGGITVMDFLFEAPSGTTFSRTAVIANPPGTDGTIQYTIADGDIEEEGRWKIQGRVQDLEGLWHTDVLEFFVGDNIVLAP